MLELQAILIMKNRLGMNTNNLISNAYNIFKNIKNSFLKRTHLETHCAVTRSVSAVVLSFSFLSYSSILP